MPDDINRIILVGGEETETETRENKKDEDKEEDQREEECMNIDVVSLRDSCMYNYLLA